MTNPNEETLRTDLACEIPKQEEGNEADGISVYEYGKGELHVSVTEVSPGAGEKSCGKPAGVYYTVSCPVMRDLDSSEEDLIADTVSVIIRELTEKISKKTIGPDTRILVVGLGNRFISADAIGPRTADKISVTGHLVGHGGIFDSLGCGSISVIHPGVMGQTGIEAAAMVKGAADYVHPDIIIAVDSLAARSTERLASVIQISDTGIEPGSGMGNRRCAVNLETAGCPVVALGVPTVVRSSTLIYDALCRAKIGTDDENIRKILKEDEGFFVSLKDSDAVTEEISKILSSSINRAFFTEGL